jgi:hypothetical protein
MYSDPSHNPDGIALAGDHSKPRVQGGVLADRLLHGMCNSDRGDGYHDHLRPALVGEQGQQVPVKSPSRDVERLAMPWIRG